jgi:hypothetical protein
VNQSLCPGVNRRRRVRPWPGGTCAIGGELLPKVLFEYTVYDIVVESIPNEESTGDPEQGKT